MGGGHVSRPDFGMPQPDPACPLTEFYLLLQHALDAAGSFALPALQLTMQDVELIDADPAALGRKLVHTAQHKRWLHHPKADTFLAGRVALLQRVYRR